LPYTLQSKNLTEVPQSVSGLAPLIPPAYGCVSNTFDQYLGMRVNLYRPINCLCLSRKNGTRPIRSRALNGIIPLGTPLNKEFTHQIPPADLSVALLAVAVKYKAQWVVSFLHKPVRNLFIFSPKPGAPGIASETWD
jgi:hypothetical protein